MTLLRTSRRWRVAAAVAAVAAIALAIALESTTPRPTTTRAAVATTASPVPAPGGDFTASDFPPLPRFGPSSIWSTRVDGGDAKLDPTSGLLVGRLSQLVDQEVSRHYGPWINTTQWSVPVYTVSEQQRRVPVVLDRPQPFAATLRASFAAGVPLPADAQAAGGTDEHLVVWQPSTDTMWEFWKIERRADGWHAQWGGTMTDVSTSPGYFDGRGGSGVNEFSWGASATSLPLVGGLITPSELKAGVIDHALALALPETRAKTWAAPAQRTDGFVDGPDSIPEGARFRLDPSLDLDRLHLPALTLILARAAQKYGIIVRDKSGNVTFYAQDPTPTGADPYPGLFGDQIPSVPLAAFPWKRLQLLPMRLDRYNVGG